jgi:hypothetical protein
VEERTGVDSSQARSVKTGIRCGQHQANSKKSNLMQVMAKRSFWDDKHRISAGIMRPACVRI